MAYIVNQSTRMSSSGHMIVTSAYDSPCGRLVLGAVGDALCLCDWDFPERRRIVNARLTREFALSMCEGRSAVIDMAKKQLDEYFSGSRREFDLALQFRGSQFRCNVWRALCKIKYGETVSYQYIADLIGRPSAVRAVATAIGSNPLSIFIPCHRVIGMHGALTGYAGGLDAKKLLLGVEGIICDRNQRVSRPTIQCSISE